MRMIGKIKALIRNPRSFIIKDIDRLLRDVELDLAEMQFFVKRRFL